MLLNVRNQMGGRHGISMRLFGKGFPAISPVHADGWQGGASKIMQGSPLRFLR